MIKTCMLALGQLEPKARTTYWILVFIRAFIGVLDLTAVVLIGLLVSLIAWYSAGTSGVQNNYLLDLLQVYPSRDLIIFLASITMTFFICKSALSALLIKFLSNYLAKQQFRATEKILKNVSTANFQFKKNVKNEEILFSIKNGTQAAYGGLLLNFSTLIAEAFLFLSMTAIFAVVNFAATVLLLLVMTSIGLFMHLYLGRRIQINSKIGASASVQIDDDWNNYASGYREILSSGREQHFRKRILDSRKSLAEQDASQSFLQSIPRFLIETTVIVIVLGIGLAQVTNVDINKTASTLGIFIAGGMRLVAAMIPLQAALGQLRQYIPEAEYALNLIRNITFKSESLAPVDVSKGVSLNQNTLDMREVSFTYGDKKSFMIENLSISVKNGEQTAIIGKSGAGKSTVADLLMGLIKPTSGAVLIEGLPVQSYLDLYPGRIGYVPQRPFRAPGSISENVALGENPMQINTQKVVEALSQVGLLTYFESLEKGLDTDITSMKLSGGQLQRLGLARALYRHCKILILDEITSSLDIDSEEQVVKVLKSLKGKVTVLIIAHRLATVQNCDKIYVLDEGKIEISGSIEHLLKSSNSLAKHLRLPESPQSSKL